MTSPFDWLLLIETLPFKHWPIKGKRRREQLVTAFSQPVSWLNTVIRSCIATLWNPVGHSQYRSSDICYSSLDFTSHQAICRSHLNQQDIDKNHQTTVPSVVWSSVNKWHCSSNCFITIPYGERGQDRPQQLPHSLKLYPHTTCNKAFQGGLALSKCSVSNSYAIRTH